MRSHIPEMLRLFITEMLGLCKQVIWFRLSYIWS